MRLFVTGICGRLGRAIAAGASYGDRPAVERLLPGCDAIIHTAGPHGASMLGGRPRCTFETWLTARGWSRPPR